MYARRLLLISFCVLLVSGSCGGERSRSWQAPVVVEVRGLEEEVVTFAQWGLSFKPLEEDDGVPVLLRDHDLLGGGGFDFFYRDSDGSALTVAFDDAHVWLDSALVGIALGSDPSDSTWQWLSTARSEDLSALRQVSVPDQELTSEQLDLLGQLFRSNRDLDFFFDSSRVLQQVLPRVQPSGLVLEEFSNQDADLIVESGRDQLKLLWVDAVDLTSLTFLLGLPHLRSLFLGSWNPDETGPLPTGLDQLQRLIVGFEGLDLEPLSSARNLRELTFVEAESLQSLDGLANLPHLEMLNLLASDSKDLDLSPLADLHALRWLILPKSTTQAEFETILQQHPELEILMFVECDEITDLSPLRELQNLKALAISTEAPLEPLYEMSHLEYLCIDVEEDESDPAVRLQEALPETVVGRVEPFCLGAGWILLLVPMAAIAWGLSKRARAAIPGVVSMPDTRSLALWPQWRSTLAPPLMAAAGLIGFAFLAHVSWPLFSVGLAVLLLAAGVLGRSLTEHTTAIPALLGLRQADRFAWLGVGSGLLFGVGLAVVFRQHSGLPGLPSVLAAFAPVAVAIGITEEIVFRGFVQGQLRPLGVAPAVVAAALLHTAYKLALFVHIPDDLSVPHGMLALWTFGVGCVLGALRQRTGLWAVLVAHASFDLIVYGHWSAAPWWVWT